MNDIQQQSYLSGFDDPAALLTYFINENDGGAVIMPVHENQSMQSPDSDEPLNPHDHAYSRSKDVQMSGDSVDNHAQHSFLNISLPQEQTSHASLISQANHSPFVSQSNLQSGIHSPSNSTYSSVLASNTSASDRGRDVTGITSRQADSGRSHVSETPPSQMISKSGFQLTSSSNTLDSYSPAYKASPIGNTQGNVGARQDNKAANVQYSRTSTPVDVSKPSSQLHNRMLGRGPQLTAYSQRETLPSDVFRDPLHEIADAHPPIPAEQSEQAEVRTVITLKIVDQVIYQGRVVKQTEKEEEFIRKGGHIPWPEHPTLSTISSPLSCNVSRSTPSGHLADISGNASRSAPETTGSKSLNGLDVQPPAPELPKVAANGGSETNSRIKHSLKSTGNGQKSNLVPKAATLKRQRPQENVSNSKKRVKPDIDSEEARRETASVLLTLQADGAVSEPRESPTSTLPAQEHDADANFAIAKFGPISVGQNVMAKWTDKNFYSGKVLKDNGDSRWQIVFDDGGKRSIHETEIISSPYLCIGQAVMATFADGFCLRGVVKRPFYENSNLFYEVEYHDNSNRQTACERFAKKDVFLTSELGVALLARQAKHTPENASKFAGVDLNNIIPKRVRVTAQKPVDEPN